MDPEIPDAPAGKALTALRREIEAQLVRLQRSMDVTSEALKPVALDPDAVGRLSRMDELQNQAMTRNLAEREAMKLGGLLAALRRMDAGTFGSCTECGAAIPLERLEVFPETATCLDCAGR